MTEANIISKVWNKEPDYEPASVLLEKIKAECKEKSRIFSSSKKKKK